MLVMEMQPRTETYVRTEVDQSLVLLADESAQEEGPLVRRLQDCGFRVLVARRLPDAVEFSTRTDLAFALLELRFGQVDTLALVSAIRRHNPSARIVVHTWFADLKAAVAVIKAGADDLLPKPLDTKFVADFLTARTPGELSYFAQIPDTASVRREHIEKIVAFSDRNISLASRRLLLDRRSLQRLMKRYDRAR
jgi:two-component system response regulator RegA